MGYATITSIQTILPKLPQTTTATGYSTAAAVISKHIDRASAVIDGYISKRYGLPFSSTIPLLVSICEDIVSYYTARSFFQQDNFNRLDSLAELKTDAMLTLKDIMDGNIDLIDSTGSLVDGIDLGEESNVDSTTYDEATFFEVDDSLDWDFDVVRKDRVSDNR
jgi:phage gp36-like protein